MRTAKKFFKKTKLQKLPKKSPKKTTSLAGTIDITKKDNSSYFIGGKNAKVLDAEIIEYKEREYKFDERLVPYYLGGDSRDGNLALRSALIRLGKTTEMTELFSAMKVGDIGYDESREKIFLKALIAIINGHDSIGLSQIHEPDIVAIHENNLKIFNDFWGGKKKSIISDKEFNGFSD